MNKKRRFWVDKMEKILMLPEELRDVQVLEFRDTHPRSFDRVYAQAKKRLDFKNKQREEALKLLEVSVNV